MKWATDNNEIKFSNHKFGREISKRHEKIRDNSGNFYKSLSINPDYTPYGISFGR